MSTMKAALFDGQGVMRIKQLPKPVPGPLDAVVRVHTVGICGSDLLMNADKTEPDDLPTGHEVAGEIVEVGEGVDPARLGERVAVETIGHGRACGDCWFCRMGQFVQCQSKDDVHGGGFAEYILRRAAGCYPLDDSLTWEEGALVEPLAVSVHGAEI